MPSEYLLSVIAFGLSLVLICIAFMLARIYKVLCDIEDQLITLNADGTPPATPIRKLPRLSRRQPEPEPGGTKVYPREAWDEGLERTDV